MRPGDQGSAPWRGKSQRCCLGAGSSGTPSSTWTSPEAGPTWGQLSSSATRLDPPPLRARRSPAPARPSRWPSRRSYPGAATPGRSQCGSAPATAGSGWRDSQSVSPSASARSRARSSGAAEFRADCSTAPSSRLAPPWSSDELLRPYGSAPHLGLVGDCPSIVKVSVEDVTASLVGIPERMGHPGELPLSSRCLPMFQGQLEIVLSLDLVHAGLLLPPQGRHRGEVARPPLAPWP